MKPQPAEDFQEWEHITQLLSSFIIHHCGYYVYRTGGTGWHCVCGDTLVSIIQAIKVNGNQDIGSPSGLYGNYDCFNSNSATRSDM